MHTLMPYSGPYAAVAALLASPLPLAPDAPPRVVLAAQIEHLIELLDAYDAATEDLEPDADFEPWLAGGYSDRGQDLELDETDDEIECEDEGAQCEDEGADVDNGDINTGEPSLGSLDGRIDQTGWAGGGVSNLEQDDSDREPDLGWSNPLGARLDGRGRLIEERVPTVRVIRRRSEVRP